jgi:hypothetical protein
MAVLYPGLPRELRDCIYEYVLTDPMGLSCRAGEDGVSRICASPGVDLRRAAATNANRRCPWRSVYSTVRAMFWTATDKPQTKTFNQIQYVNREFRRETFGLEFRYNSIVFEDAGHLSAAQRCRTFVNEVAGRHYADELKLCIMGSRLSVRREFKDQAPTLLEFCAQHPKATIRSHDPHWSLEDPKFILIGLGYTIALRGDRLILGELMRHSSPLLTFDLSDACPALPKRIPRNYRILPVEKQLSRAMLRESCERSFILDGTDLLQWIHLAEQWFKEGV